MEAELFPIDVDYIVVDGSPVVRLFCVDEKGERKTVYDDAFRPYCYIQTDEERVLSELKDSSFLLGTESLEMRRLGRKIAVTKVTTKLPEDVPKLRQFNWPVYDADIPFYKRYLLDRGIGTSTRLSVDLDGDRITRIRKTSVANPPIRSIALDIETYSKRSFPDPKIDPIVAVSIYNHGVRKCITWLDSDADGVEKVEDEKALILRLAQFVSDGNFNVIVGYNSDTFDLPYIRDRADILGIKPLFNGFEIKSRNGRRVVSEINGTAHVDVLNFIRNIYAVYNLKTETLSLKEVALEMLGERKGEFDWSKVDKIFTDKDLANELCSYCIKDSYLTFKIFGELYDIIIEINKLVGQTLSDISRMTTGAVVEHLLMKRAAKEGELIPNKPSDFEVNERIKRINVGAFVYQPKPGLYKDVGVVDFRSLYPSIIISHNICPSTIRFAGIKAEFEKLQLHRIWQFAVYPVYELRYPFG